MEIKGHFHCPVNGWDCPYYKDGEFSCQCTLENPMEECDDFYAMWEECEPYEYTCYGECKGCDNCAHSNQFTLDDVASCNCCENYSYYTPKSRD